MTLDQTRLPARRVPTVPQPCLLVSRLGRAALLRGTALQAAFALTVAIVPSPALAQPAPNARPQGGQVVAGSATIARTPGDTVIMQSSDRAAIDWRSFNVGSNQAVTFRQPSAASATLNRVTGPDPSAIAGRITANGQFILTNPNGVTFYRGAQVNAQSVIVSAPGITNQNFMAGRMVFDGKVNPNARIDNAGTITVKEAGLAALVAPSVANSGTIDARLGQVILGGAAAHTLDMYGDGLVSIDVTKQIRQIPIGPDGKPVTALVTNTGTILADGGTIQLTARAVDGVVQTLVDARGTLQANTLGAKTGQIEIAGTGGSVIIAGRIATDAAGGTAGTIVLNGSTATTLRDAAHVTADGRTGGGTIAIGTTLARARSLGVAPAATSAQTTVAAGARVSANATATGNGGRVTVLSTTATSVAGSFEAKGGTATGNGGTIEFSGGSGFTLTGHADTSAPNGTLGTIVLDPRDLLITSNPPSGTANPTPATTDPNIAANTGGTTTDAYVTPAQLQALTGNLHLLTTRDLTVDSPLNYTAGSVVLEAGRNLTVSANGSITASGNLNLLAASATIPGFDSTGAISIAGAISGQSILLSAGTGGIAISSSATATTALSISTVGALTQTAGTITTPQMYGTAGSVSLAGSNAIDGVGNGTNAAFQTTSGGFLLTGQPGRTLTIGSAGGGGGLFVAAGQPVTLTVDGLVLNAAGAGKAITATGSTLLLQAADADRSFLVSATNPGSGAPVFLSLPTLSRLSIGTLQIGTITNTNGGITLGQSGEAIDLTAAGIGKLGLATRGNISQGGPLTVSDLAVSSLGGTNLSNTANRIDTLSSLGANGPTSITTAGNLALTGSIGSDSATITAGGNITQSATSFLDASDSVTLAAGNGSVPGFNPAAAITLAGRVRTANTLTLSSGSGGIALTGPVFVTDLAVTTSGTLSQGTNSISATTLRGSAGAVNLPSTANAIQGIGNFTVTGTSGDFVLVDSNALSISNGGISTQFGRSINLATDSLTLSGTALSAPSGQVAVQPYTASTPILLTTSTKPTGTLALTTTELADIAAFQLILGGTNQGTALRNTGTITLGKSGETIDLTSLSFGALGLNTTGAVVQGGPLYVPNVTATVGSLTLDTAGNLIGTISGVSATGDIGLHTDDNLSVGFTSAGGNVNLSSGGTNGMTLFGTITGQVVNLNSLSSSIANPTPSDPGITQTGGSITATTLTGAAGSAQLTSANAVRNLGDFVTYSGLRLNDGTTPLAVTGAVSSTTGAISLSAAGLTQSGTSSITTPEFNGSAGATTALTATGNAIAAIGAFTQSAGDFALSTSSPTLTLGNGGAQIAATSGSLAFIADRVAIAPATRTVPTLSAPLGAVTFSPYTASRRIELIGSSAADANSLSIGQGVLSQISAARLGLGRAATSPINIGNAGETIDLRARVSTLQLQTTGTVTQAATSGLIVNTLAGTAGTLTFGSAGNAINALNGLSTTGGSLLLQSSASLTATDTTASAALTLGTAGDLSTAGTLSAGTTLTLTATGAVTTAASMTGSTIAINGATGITQSAGSIAAGTVTLSAPGRAIAQSAGTIAATTLTTNSATLSLPDANTIAAATIAATGAVTLNDTAALTLNALSATDATVTTTAGLTLSGAVNASGTLALRSGGAITQPGGIVTANILSTTSSGATTVNQSNAIATLASATSSGGLSVTDAGNLIVTGPLSDPTAITLISSGGTLTLAGSLTTGGLSLTSNGALTQTAGIITAASLGGSASNATLNQANAIATLTGFTTRPTTTTGSFALTDSSPLTITGAVTAGSTITLNTAAVTETGRGALIAPTLTGSATSATLTGPNQIGTLAAFTASGDLAFANSADLSVIGPVAAQNLSLSSTGTLALSGNITGSVATTLTANTITQPGGALTTNSLSTTSSATTTLGQQNVITTLAAASSSGGLTVVDAGALTVTGPVADQTAVTLRTGALTLAGPISTGTLTVTIGGALTQTAGAITANSLGGTAGSAAFTQPNAIGTLTSFTTTGSFALTDSTALTIAGAITAGTGQTIALTTGTLTFGSGAALIAPGGTVSLAEFTPGVGITLGGNSLPVTAARLSIGSATGGPITITGGFALPGGTLDLQSGAAVTETGAGAVTAATLTGRASSATLTGANQIGTLGSFATTGNLTFANTADLAVAGPVTAANATLSSTGALAFSGPVTTTGTLTLTASGAISQTGGTLTAAALTGSANGVALTQPNAVAALGNFTSTGSFALTDATALAINGTVTAGSSTGPAQTISLIAGGALTETTAGALVAATLTGSAASATLTGGNQIVTLGAFSTTGDLSFANRGDLGVAGPVAGANVTLSSTGSIALSGNVTSPGLTTLTAGAAITQPGGILTTNRLSLTSATTTILGQQNAIATLAAASSKGGLTVVDAGALTVTGPVADQTAVTLRTGALTLAGPISTGTLTVTIGGALTQTAGAITANSLGGTAGSAAFTQPNAIGTLTGFTTTGSFALTDSTALTIGGAITAGTGQTIALTTGTLTFGSGAALIAPGGTVSLAEFTPGVGITLGGNSLPVTAARLSIGSATGGPITITGGFALPGGTLDLQSGAAVTETGAGAVTAATLTGRASSATLTGANQIGTLGSFATTGNLSFANTADLAVAGPVTAANATLSSTGALAFSGAVTTTGTLTLTAFGAISQTGGILTAAALTGSASSVALTQPNAVAALGNFTSAGSFALTDASRLGITGTVTGGTGQAIALRTDALTFAAGSGLIVPGGAITLAEFTPGVGITVSGSPSTISATTVTLGSASGGALTLAGFFDVPGVTLDLESAGAITETGAGAIRAAGLTGRTAAATLTGANQIGTLGRFATTGDFSFANATDLAVAGPVTGGNIKLATAGNLALSGTLATPGTLTLSAAGAITQPGGALSAAALTGSAFSAILDQATNAVPNLAGFITTGDFTYTNNGNLTVTALVDPNTVTMNVAGSLTIASVIAGTNVILNARDGITETASGQIVATTLSGSAGSAALGSANQVDTIAGFATTNGFALNTTRALAVTGPLTDQRGGISLAAPSIGLAGPLTAPSLTFATPGALSQSGGPIAIGTLTGSANSIDIGNRGPASIATLGAATAATSLAINDGSTLRITGPVAAPVLTIAATGALVLDGGAIRTDGQPFSAQLGATPAAGGSNLAVRPGAAGTASIVQLGTTTLTSLSGGSATLRFDLPAAGGTLSLNDLQAGDARVVLSLGSGNAFGTLNVSQLAVLGSGGRADLTGQIGTRTDSSAAQLAQLLPGTDLRYTFNQCAIASVTCSSDTISTILVPGAAVASILRPDILTLDVLDLSVTRDRDDPTLLLPNISDRDY